MLALSLYTLVERFRVMAFANVEDTVNLKVKPRTDDNVERIRRAHLNDLENISLFFVIGFIYTLTNPSLVLATQLFRIYTAARIMHTIVYAVFVVPQPARVLSWGTGFAITGYMAFKSILHFL
ncbi:MAPEG domain containing protein [Asbolus verrucosus]|uniref:Microsomal glutathione S-transferase 1 n=1 Tax=Asbolus verrucosus TaxID=1661398 RepID=A0A482W7G5_ASBVE|nr:MAPEG domain containing protein [Asbolus verrucosus]